MSTNNALTRQIARARRKRKLYKARREEAYAILGGAECVWCGTGEELTLDHIDPAMKEVKANQLHYVSRKRFLKEVTKLQVLCKRCHDMKTKLERNGGVHLEFNWNLGREVPPELLVELFGGVEEEDPIYA